MKRIAVVSLLALAPSLVSADSVFLKGGGEIKGEIVEQRADAVVLEVGPGRVTLPMTQRGRASSPARPTSASTMRGRPPSRPRDVAGWLSLAAWAQRHDLGHAGPRSVRARAGRRSDERRRRTSPWATSRMGDRWLERRGCESRPRSRRVRGHLDEPRRAGAIASRSGRREARGTAGQPRSRRARRAKPKRERARPRRGREAAEADARQAQIGQGADGGIPYPCGVRRRRVRSRLPGAFDPFPAPVVDPRPGRGHGNGHGHRSSPASASRPDPPRPRTGDPARAAVRQAAGPLTFA